MVDDEFEWDAAKAEANLRKHNVSFQTARRVFDDAFAVYGIDDSHDEDRIVITGMVDGVLLTIIYTDRHDRIRIISARKATRHEQRDYYRGQTPP